MQTQPETKMGQGVAAPKPRCIAYPANALSTYTVPVIERNRIAAVQGSMLAEAPENAL